MLQFLPRPPSQSFSYLHGVTGGTNTVSLRDKAMLDTRPPVPAGHHELQELEATAREALAAQLAESARGKRLAKGLEDPA